jgi:hypothetical protein
MMELLISRLMAAVAAALLIACVVAVFAQVQTENKDQALQDEAGAIARALALPTDGSGSVLLHGRDLLPAGHRVALVGSVLVLRAEGRAFPVANLSALRNEMGEAWTSASDLCLRWSQEGTYLYLLNESASLSTAADSRRQSSLVL